MPNFQTVLGALKRAMFPAATTRLILTPNGYLLGYGSAVPSNGAGGYAPGAIFIHVSATNTLYRNVGTQASAAFQAITSEDGVAIASGTVVPSDGAAGYAKGLIFVHTDAATPEDSLHVNVGTSGSADFDQLVRSFSYIGSATKKILAWGTTVPSDAATGYAPGCIFIDTNAVTNNLLMFINLGDETSCDFDGLDGAGGAFVGAITMASTLGVTGAVTLSNALAVTGIISSPASMLLTAGAATAAVVLRLGQTVTEGLEVKVIDEDVTLTNAVKTDLTSTVPSGAVILSHQANLESAVSGDGSGDDGLTKVAVGVASDPDKYGKTSGLTQNLKIDTIPDWAVLSGVETISVYATDNNGAAVTEKFTAGGIVRVRIIYLALNSLDNA